MMATLACPSCRTVFAPCATGSPHMWATAFWRACCSWRPIKRIGGSCAARLRAMLSGAPPWPRNVMGASVRGCIAPWCSTPATRRAKSPAPNRTCTGDALWLSGCGKSSASIRRRRPRRWRKAPLPLGGGGARRPTGSASPLGATRRVRRAEVRILASLRVAVHRTAPQWRRGFRPPPPFPFLPLALRLPALAAEGGAPRDRCLPLPLAPPLGELMATRTGPPLPAVLCFPALRAEDPGVWAAIFIGSLRAPRARGAGSLGLSFLRRGRSIGPASDIGQIIRRAALQRTATLRRIGFPKTKW